MSDVTTQATPSTETVVTGTAVAMPALSSDLTVQVGKNLKSMTVEAVMVMGGKHAAESLADMGAEVALKKAQHGNYKAAAEIIALAAHAQAVKFLAPEAGGTWTKATVQMLAEKTLARVSTSDKGWNTKQLRGRAMARAITALFAA